MQVVVAEQIVVLIVVVELVGQVVEERVLLLIKAVLQGWQVEQTLVAVVAMELLVILHL
jgi:hypothetical protein